MIANIVFIESCSYSIRYFQTLESILHGWLTYFEIFYISTTTRSLKNEYYAQNFNETIECAIFSKTAKLMAHSEWLKESSGWNTKYWIVPCLKIAKLILDIALNERCLQFRLNLSDGNVTSGQKLDSDFGLIMKTLCYSDFINFYTS